MSYGKALYFPYIHFQNEEWLKYSLLYWDCIKRIVPRSYTPRDSDAIKMLVDAEMVENVDPGSGKTAYTVSAAEQFIPTMKALVEKRGNLNRGAHISKEMDENAPEALVHIQKMDEKVIYLLETSELASRHGDWFSMDGELAGYYMLCLSAHISEKQNAPLLSDSFEMETGGTYFQHSRIPAEMVGQPDDDVGFLLAKMVLPVVRPENLAAVPMKKIVDFHKKSEAERMAFRKTIEDFVKDAASLDDPVAVKDFLEEKKKIIESGLKDQSKRIDELGVEAVHSFACISIPTGITAFSTGLNPIATAIAGGVGIAFAIINWFAKTRGKRRQAIRQCDWHYLLSVEKKFNAEEIASSGQNGMLQFVYD